MFFNQRNKVTFGSNEEDPSDLAEKLQAIAYVACGCFEGDISEIDQPLAEDAVVWKLSNHYETGSVPFNTENKIKAAYKSLEHKSVDKAKILEKIALKYKIDMEEEEENDSEYSSDLLYHTTTEDEESLLDDENTILHKDKHYFGHKAKHEFWHLYKSERTFKDQGKEEIKDPRFAYIKTCQDLKMLPKAGMVIRSEKTTHLSYANFGLLQKNSVAVAESLKRYPLEIEALDFTGNGIRPKECILLTEALDNHLGTLIYLNFSGNKIGFDGAKVLGERLAKMKLLENINLSGNLMGDEAANEILKGLSALLALKSINLSNNALGQKFTENEFIENLGFILK